MRTFLIFLALISTISTSAQTFKAFQLVHKQKPVVYQVVEGQVITVKLKSGERVKGFFYNIDSEKIRLQQEAYGATVLEVDRKMIAKINVKRNRLAAASGLFMLGGIFSLYSGAGIVSGLVFEEMEFLAAGLAGGALSFLVLRLAVNQLSYRLPLLKYQLLLPNEKGYYKPN